ncbi:thiolase [Infundibulicybe gibba]|nr:thiolase [Infundibulicybe gibba]
MNRVKQLATHLAGNTSTDSNVGALEEKRPDDVVITMAIRSPLCKANKGGFKDARYDSYIISPFPSIDPSIVGDICVGTVLTTDAMYHARGAALAAGFPDTVPVQCINRFCASGLMAVSTIANQIKVGQIEVGLAVGVESMSENPENGGPPQSDLISTNPPSADCCKRMAWTSENVASDFGITREEQDAFAATNGYFAEEIVPFTVYRNDPSQGRQRVIISKDDGTRAGVTKESLAKLKPAFPQWAQGGGTTTVANACQVTDGASAVLLMSRRKAEELGLTILGKYLSVALAGVPPRVMGIGPVYAIPTALKNCGIRISDVDLFEVNEAFASQCVYVVNVNGGAIAFGHPLDKCNNWPIRNTGTRQIATGLHELRRRRGKILVTTMCIGGGMGAAGVFLGEY